MSDSEAFVVRLIDFLEALCAIGKQSVLEWLRNAQDVRAGYVQIGKMGDVRRLCIKTECVRRSSLGAV